MEHMHLHHLQLLPQDTRMDMDMATGKAPRCIHHHRLYLYPCLYRYLYLPNNRRQHQHHRLRALRREVVARLYRRQRQRLIYLLLDSRRFFLALELVAGVVVLEVVGVLVGVVVVYFARRHLHLFYRLLGLMCLVLLGVVLVDLEGVVALRHHRHLPLGLHLIRL